MPNRSTLRAAPPSGEPPKPRKSWHIEGGDEWAEYAACFNHKVLSPEAWHAVANGPPTGDGARAIFTCRQICPVQPNCLAEYARNGTPGTAFETIAGGGWFSARGKFYAPPDGLMNIAEAAACLGLEVNKALRILRDHAVTAPGRMSRLRNWYSAEFVKELARNLGMEHGTMRAAEHHHLHREPLCTPCSRAWNMEENVAA